MGKKKSADSIEWLGSYAAFSDIADKNEHDKLESLY
jgi:hypothetical protein